MRCAGKCQRAKCWAFGAGNTVRGRVLHWNGNSNTAGAGKHDLQTNIDFNNELFSDSSKAASK